MIYPMLSLLRQPDIYLILAVISFSAAVVWTYIGKAWTRFYGWVYRAEEPTSFWWVVAVYFLGGALFIGLFMYEAYGLSH
jgi:H+/Cl- antiporter ClcA